MPEPNVAIYQPVDETGESYRRMREPGTLAILACGQETRPRSRGELDMVRKLRGGARGAGVFGSTPIHRGWGQFVTSREKEWPR